MTTTDPIKSMPGRTLRDVQRETTRARLIDAAQESFVTSSYTATTIDEIVRRAGVTRATYYLHFGSKSNIVPELSRRLKMLSTGLDEHLGIAIRAGDRVSIRAWLAAAFQFWDEIRPVAVAIEEAASIEPQVRDLRQADFEDHVRIIAAGLEESSEHAGPTAHTRATLAYSQFQSLFYRWTRVGWDADREETLDIVSEMWLAAFRDTKRSVDPAQPATSTE
jgi:AcrR family transcriptional regulator